MLVPFATRQIRSNDERRSSRPGVCSSSDVAEAPGSPLALFVFAVVEVFALMLYLANGDGRWFFLDEWDFLADRELSSVDDLLRPHAEHWTTLPIVAYRVCWQIFGLNTYVPYQLVTIVLHLLAALLLRLVMRRAAVDPWIATLVASVFVLFGSASQDIVWAFQMTFGGALVFGLTHLLLADHDGPIDRRDWLGLLAGVAGLMCSGVGVTMTIVVAMAVLARRGLLIALLHSVPLGVVFVAWWAAYGRDSYGTLDLSVDAMVRFVVTGITATFGALGQVPGVGIVLGVLLVVGLPLAWLPLDRTELRRRAAAPGAMLAGAVVFLLVSGVGRAASFGTVFAREGRYLHIVGALVLPAVAVAANALIQQWRVLWPAVILLLIAGIPGNIQDLADQNIKFSRLVVALPSASRASEVPRAARPVLGDTSQITMGWLRDGVAAGRIPEQRLEPKTAATANLSVALTQTTSSKPPRGCERLKAPVTRTLRKGEMLQFRGLGIVRISELDADGNVVAVVGANLVFGDTITANVGPLRLRFESGFGPELQSICN